MLKKLIFIILVAITAQVSAADATSQANDSRLYFPEADTPTKWDGKTNVTWKASLPGSGASPAVACGDLIIVTCNPETVVALHANDGSIAWTGQANALELFGKDGADNETTLTTVLNVARGKLNGKDPASKKAVDNLKKDGGITTKGLSDYAVARPLTDGKHVWVTWYTGSIACFEAATGKRVWQTLAPAGKKVPAFMRGRSLILHEGSLYILQPCPTQGKKGLAFAALDATTGKSTGFSSTLSGGDHAGDGLATIATVAGSSYFVTAPGQVVDPTTGKVVASGLGNMAYGTTPVADGSTVWFGKHGRTLSKDGDKLSVGGPAPEHKMIDHTLVGTETVLVIQKSGGNLLLDKSGNLLKENFQVTAGKGKFHGLTLAGKHGYVVSSDGKVRIYTDRATNPEIISTISMPEDITAPIGVAGNTLLVRTETSLYAIGK